MIIKPPINRIVQSVVISFLLIITTFLTTNGTLAATFPDVPEDAWFHPYVTDLVENEIVEGYPDGRFGSWDPINRAELSKIIFNLKQLLHKNVLEDNIVEIILVFSTVLGWIYIISATKKNTFESDSTLHYCPNCQEEEISAPPVENFYNENNPKKPTKNNNRSNNTPINEVAEMFDQNDKSNWWM